MDPDNGWCGVTALVLRGDARALPLPDDSVDLVVTSPPYFALRSYQDGGEHYAGQIGDEPTPQEFVAALLEVTRECMRVLKPSGSLWVNLGDKYAGDGRGTRPQGTTGQRADRTQAATYATAGLRRDEQMRQGARDGNRRSRPQPVRGIRGKSLMGLPWRYALGCVDDLGLILRAEVIWAKPNGLPESVTDRVRRSHEQWFHFTLEPRYYSDVDPIREDHSPVSVDRSGRNRFAEDRSQIGVGSPNTVDPTKSCNPAGKLPVSVWTIPTQPLSVPGYLGVDHFAAFPIEWPRRIISGWCPENGVVLDPFGGTGTTALVASCLGRTGITVDRSSDYCRLAAWRTTDRNQRAKVLGHSRIVEQPAEQSALF